VEGVAVQLTDLNAIVEAFGQIPGVKQVNNKVTNQPSSIATRVYFGNNSAEIVLQDVRTKILPIKKLMLQYPTLKLKVTGHTHESEGGDNAQQLALERAQAVQLVLEDQGIDRRRTKAVGIVGSPNDITPNQPIWLSRCVLFEIIKNN
jgi:outer membrane protein OmpA-like peptidoglycan-associated protein